MVDMMLILNRMQERNWRELSIAYSKGDILNVCRLIYKHLQADQYRKRKLASLEKRQSPDIGNMMAGIQTVEDLERLWK